MLNSRDKGLLEIVARNQASGISPSVLAFCALEAGLVNKSPNSRTTWTAQGAGFLGGKLLADLERRGLVRGGGRFGRDYRLTPSGQAALAVSKDSTHE